MIRYSKRLGWIVRVKRVLVTVLGQSGGGARVGQKVANKGPPAGAKAGDLTIHLRSRATPLTALSDAI